MDANFGEITLQFDESFINGKGTDCCQDARGLRSIMEKLLLECMYDISDKDSVDKVVLNKDAVVANNPIIVYKEKEKIKKKVGENYNFLTILIVWKIKSSAYFYILEIYLFISL